jgi:hypothetical protein
MSILLVHCRICSLGTSKLDRKYILIMYCLVHLTYNDILDKFDMYMHWGHQPYYKDHMFNSLANQAL